MRELEGGAGEAGEKNPIGGGGQSSGQPLASRENAEAGVGKITL